MTINSRSAKLSSPNVKIQDVPNIPTVGTPVQDSSNVNVPFTPAATGGRAAVYRAVSSPSGADAISYGSSPIVVSSGLTAGTAYTFTVRGETSTGATTGYSSTSSAITPFFSDMELIATAYPGGTTSVTFDISSLGSSFKHLQVRTVAQSTHTGYEGLRLRFNGDSGTNYSTHYLFGTGSSVGYGGQASTTGAYVGLASPSSASNNFGASVVTINDFASSTKNKTTMAHSGVRWTSSESTIHSGAWYNTAPITSLTFYGDTGATFIAGTRISIYGIKG